MTYRFDLVRCLGTTIGLEGAILRSLLSRLHEELLPDHTQSHLNGRLQFHATDKRRLKIT